MGQKVNPHGIRVGVIKDWDSRWFAKDNEFGDLLVEDYNIRKYLKKTLYAAGVPTIEIERSNGRVKIFISCARPGIVIGKGGEDIEKLRKEMEKMLGKPVSLNRGIIPADSAVITIVLTIVGYFYQTSGVDLIAKNLPGVLSG